jgi:hypothetical protein
VPSFAVQWLMPRLAWLSAQHSSIDVRLNTAVRTMDLSAGQKQGDPQRSAATSDLMLLRQKLVKAVGLEYNFRSDSS